MQSFLQLLAKDIIGRFGTDFRHLTVIFPNKRAGLFLAEALSRHIQEPVWMPEILTLPEYIGKHTGLQQAEALSLIIRLYKSYREVSGTTERFEDFYFWGNMLLGDFDDIDKYLADAKDLFSNLVALKELEHNFPYLTGEQIEVIQKFWSSFQPGKFSREQEEFLKVWDKLYPTYRHFKERLFEAGLCYDGMNERYFCEHIGEYEHPGHLIFAGFNALNICEKQIFSYYRDLGIATFYWDYDLYYTTAEHQEAGHYLRENLKHYPNALDMGQFNNFRYNGKRIEYISVPSIIGQVKLLEQLTAHLDREEPRNTAIVLCDEQLLIPAMYSIPEKVAKINVTMGYPAQNTSVAALISLLCDLKNYARSEEDGIYYYYKPVVALLNHKFIKDLCPKEINEITNYIRQRNIVYVPEKSLHFHPLTEAVFSSKAEQVPEYLLRVLGLLSREQGGIYASAIEKEFIFTLYTQIRNLQNTFEEEGIEPEEKLYRQIVEKVIANTTIPFSGEPLEGLQMMGLMETRMLDFEHLIILSANEGVLPRNSLPSSFIPYNLRVGFRLPTPEHLDAISAYYFYRLLQRAKDIKILYTSGVKGMNSGEMSRFLHQIKLESGLTVKESNFQNTISTQNPRPITIAKEPAILEVLAAYTQSAEKLLSPSALNIYLECPLKFYFRYIAHIQEQEEIAEELDHRLLGNIFHESSQSLYATVADKEITAEVIDSLLANDALIDEHIRQSYAKIYDTKTHKLLNNGNNELILSVIKKYIREMFTYDKRQCPFRMVAMESRFYTPVRAGETGQTVYVGGFIDRIDRTREGFRIIDYKTGGDSTDFTDIASVFDTENKKRNKAAFQTMLYCLMFDHTHPGDTPLIPGIYSTKQLFGKEYDFRLECDKVRITDFHRYEEEFRQYLEALLAELFSPVHPFTQTENLQKCRYCPYAAICRR